MMKFAIVIILLTISFLVGIYLTKPVNISDLSVIRLTPTNTPIPTIVQPSERALKAASEANLYGNTNDEARTQFINNWGNGTNDVNVAITQFALSLDRNPAKLVNIETSIEKVKFDLANRAKIINQQSPVYVQQPNYQPPAILPQQTLNCMSSSIGDYTYTNCF